MTKEGLIIKGLSVYFKFKRLLEVAGFSELIIIVIYEYLAGKA